MELHQVDAVAVAVVAMELRLVLVGQEAGRHQRAAGRSPALQALLGPAALVATHPLLERQVEAVEVDAIQRRYLVGHFVGFGVLVQVHEGSSQTGAPTARRQKFTRAVLTGSRLGSGWPLSRAARAGETRGRPAPRRWPRPGRPRQAAPGKLECATAPALLEQFDEQCGVGLAIAQALLVDFRIHRLGDQGEGQPLAAPGARGKAPQALGQAPGGRAGTAQDHGQGIDLTLAGAAEDFRRQLALPRKWRYRLPVAIPASSARACMVSAAKPPSATRRRPSWRMRSRSGIALQAAFGDTIDHD